MAGQKRWPPLLIPQVPPAWIHAGLLAAIVGSIVMAGDALATPCGFGDELCHPLFASLGAITTTVFWFWLLAPPTMIAVGLVHVARVTISWLRLDVVRPRRV